MMRGITGPIANAVLRQIALVARLDGTDRQKPILIVEEIRSADWASLTFEGQRHEFDLRLEGEAGEVAAAVTRLEADLAEAEIPLGRGFVAEVRIIAGDCRTLAQAGHVARQLRIEALSIRD